MSEGVVAKWHKKEGDFVRSGDVLLEISTDKATVEHEALDEGFLRKILVKEGDTAEVNGPIALFTETENETVESAQEAKKETVKEKTVPKTESTQVATKITLPPSEPLLAKGVMASPLARKLAEQKGIDLSRIQGSGPRGRIVSADLEKAKPSAPNDTIRYTETEELPFEEEKLSPMRKVIASRLQESKTTIPHFYIRQDIDVENLVRIREDLKAKDHAFTVNDFIVKAVAQALKKHPEVNSGFNEQTQTIIRYKRVDLAIAVTIAQGLITPIVRNAAEKSLSTLSAEIKTLATKARDGKLSPQEYQGGSFTISNLGMFGTTEFGAIVNPPQVAILAIGAIQELPVVKNGTCVPGKKMTLTLSCDHRVVDGSLAAQFMKTLKELLETPTLFLI